VTPRITSLAFLTPGNFADDDPYPGLEDTLQPHDPGLTDRVWYGGGSLRSMRWAGERGLNLLTGNIVTGETSDEFGPAQLALVDEYRRAAGSEQPGQPERVAPHRIALGRVVVPFDSATEVTRARYRAYAAGRHERTRGPQLPYEFDRADYEQILPDARHLIAPELGWRPGNSTMPSEILNKAIPLYPHALTGEGSSGIRTRNGVHGAHQGPFAPGGCSRRRGLASRRVA
jgi:alkanesulfonate monooxygenase SsuD/methylene tetrahydromethanopterin reductase-like flavin-dependent oxidoreductase (luciferase family)